MLYRTTVFEILGLDMCLSDTQDHVLPLAANNQTMDVSGAQVAKLLT